MSTFYLDFALGDDTNDGSAFGAGTAWKTITSGATAARIAPGDIIKIAKSPAPVDLGITAKWTTTTVVGGGMPATMAVTGTANNGSGLIRVAVADTSTLATNDVVQILSMGGTIEGNENWLITVIDGTHFDLVGSAYANAWTSGGTVQKINSKAVVLGTSQTANIDLCENAYTAVTGLITVLNATPTAGGTGYTLNDILTITTGGTGATCKVTGVSAGVVTAVTLLIGGNGGYTTGAAKATTGGTGTLCTVNITTVANVTQTPTAVTSDGKEGAFSEKITTPSAVKAGSKLAYRAITPGSLSGYQTMSFWIKNSATITAGQWRIVLCSDAIGETIVDEFLIPAILSTALWVPLNITKTGGGNLGASTASIAIYSDTIAPTSASNILLDNIIACTTSGLNLQSLISKNTLEQGGAEGWYGIQSINGKIVLLDNGVSTVGNAGRGYFGTTETVETYIREPINLTTTQNMQDSGTNGNNIQFQGGYDTGTGNQTGETFISGYFAANNSSGIFGNAQSYITINRINTVRWNGNAGFDIRSVSSYITLDNISSSNNIGAGVYFTGRANLINNLSNSNNNTGKGLWLQNVTASINNFVLISNLNNNLSFGLYFYNGASNNTIGTISKACNNITAGIYIGESSSIPCFQNSINLASDVSYNSSYGVYYINGSTENYINSLTTSNNLTGGVIANNCPGFNYIKSATISESTQVNIPTGYVDSRVFIEKIGGNYSKIFTDGGNIVSEATTLTNGSGTQWKLTTETNGNRNSDYPLNLSIAKIAVTANNLVTVKAWFLKGHATNIGAKLVCKGGHIAGVAADVTATKANDTSEEELTITFTPTEAGVVEIEAWAYYVAGHSTVIVDAITITQA